MTTSPTFTVRDGDVIYYGPDDAPDGRGTYLSPFSCERLMAAYRASAGEHAWQSPFAEASARLLEAAMREAGISHTEQEAA